MRSLPPEFLIDEAPLPTVHSGESLAAVWADLLSGAGAADQALRELRHKLAQAKAGELSARRDLCLEIIEQVIDNLDRMIWDAEREDAPSSPATVKWLKRARTTRRTLETLLVREYVAPMERVAAGIGVEVVDVVPRDDVPEGTITELILRGWLWRGEILRNTKAIVAVPATAATQETRVSFTEGTEDNGDGDTRRH